MASLRQARIFWLFAVLLMVAGQLMHAHAACESDGCPDSPVAADSAHGHGHHHGHAERDNVPCDDTPADHSGAADSAPGHECCHAIPGTAAVGAESASTRPQGRLTSLVADPAALAPEGEARDINQPPRLS